MRNRVYHIQYTFLLFLSVTIFFQSCVKHPDSPGYEYSDDMTRSQAIEAYVDYGLVADKMDSITIGYVVPVTKTDNVEEFTSLYNTLIKLYPSDYITVEYYDQTNPYHLYAGKFKTKKEADSLKNVLSRRFPNIDFSDSLHNTELKKTPIKKLISARIPAEGSIPYSANKNTAMLNMPFNYGPGEDERIRAGEEVFLPKRYYQNEDVSKSNIAEGKRLYGLFCAHCHGDKGNGDGKVITVGGYPAAPPAYNTLTDRSPGSVFHTITHGKNAMGPHASQLNKDERWKVSMYVRTMQFGGELNIDELTAENATTE